MDRSENMRRIRGKHTGPEMMVRRIIHGLGYRYRLHRTDMPGTPDLVFPGRRKLIFVHGCFWHQHRNCVKAHIPQSHQDYWEPKLARNKLRDAKNLRALRGLQWDCLVLWECQLSRIKWVTERIRQFLEGQ